MRSTIRCLFVILPDPQQVTSIAVIACGEGEGGEGEGGEGEGGEGEGGEGEGGEGEGGR